jgi:hypothetical protein
MRRGQSQPPPLDVEARSALPGSQYAKLVAIGISHDHPTDIALADVDPSGAKRDEAVYLRSLITVVRRSDVDVEPILCVLR